MKITHYLYNAFLIAADGVKLAIDPGQNLGLFSLRSLIPPSEWPTITHVVITHGDPDHHWQSDRVARASGAAVVCGAGLTRSVGGVTLVVAPRGRALTSANSLLTHQDKITPWIISQIDSTVLQADVSLHPAG